MVGRRDPHRPHPVRRDHGDRAQRGGRRGFWSRRHPGRGRLRHHRRRLRRGRAHREDGRHRPASRAAPSTFAQRSAADWSTRCRTADALSTIGTVAMLWVGGHILLLGKWTRWAGTRSTAGAPPRRPGAPRGRGVSAACWAWLSMLASGAHRIVVSRSLWRSRTCVPVAVRQRRSTAEGAGENNTLTSRPAAGHVWSTSAAIRTWLHHRNKMPSSPMCQMKPEIMVARFNTDWLRDICRDITQDRAAACVALSS